MTLGSSGKPGVQLKTAKPHHADDLVKIAQPRLDLSEEIDGARAGGALAVLNRYLCAQFSLGDQFSIPIEA